MRFHGLPKALKAMDHWPWHDAVPQDLYLATAAATWRYWFEANQLVDPGSTGRCSQQDVAAGSTLPKF
jgi:hypothetical protein